MSRLRFTELGTRGGGLSQPQGLRLKARSRQNGGTRAGHPARGTAARGFRP